MGPLRDVDVIFLIFWGIILLNKKQGKLLCPQGGITQSRLAGVELLYKTLAVRCSYRSIKDLVNEQ
jgi:hypothetical protein